MFVVIGCALLLCVCRYWLCFVVVLVFVLLLLLLCYFFFFFFFLGGGGGGLGERGGSEGLRDCVFVCVRVCACVDGGEG